MMKLWQYSAWSATQATHTFTITMAVFDMAQHVVSGAAGVIGGDTNIDVDAALSSMQAGLDAMLPCFLLAMYEKHGQPLEVVIKNVIQTKFIRPKERPYQTENFYVVIEKQRKLEKEVSAIVNGRTKNHDPRGKKSREA